MEKMIGRVKNIPISTAINPSAVNTIETIIKRRIAKKFLETIKILASMASNAFNLPKIMKGMVKTVRNWMKYEMNLTKNRYPENSISVTIRLEAEEIKTPEITSCRNKSLL